jgi:hypothetical protein
MTRYDLLARYDGHGACRIRIAAAKATNDWIHILQFEQRGLGHMGVFMQRRMH